MVCIEDHTDIFGNSIYVGQVFNLEKTQHRYYIIGNGYFPDKFFVELCIWRDYIIDEILSDA